MAKAKLNSDLIATVAGDITVFNYNGETREYLSSSVEYLAVGIGLPANSCIDAPGEVKAGSTICRTEDFTAWEYVADHRGETVWNTQTGESEVVALLGDYPTGTTTIPPVTPYDVWDGEKWATDESAKNAAEVAAAESKKYMLIQSAGNSINPLQDAVELGIATDEEKSRYDAWRKYRVLLTRVDISLAPDINWPEPPED
ncbi:tail fiber assembly protein [Salmonella enterica subsp. enterica]|uniref:Putative bacteriophage tail fiber assembly protein n=1 Tax=Salmonella enterica I TaxID=59201 RepID=A0A379UWE5_SALET|nr:tail fiber assembly protein [Salmonella enterica subsp. enterica serovar Kirkee]SUG72221.1 putative bacteriophage tail fiber assembly protein [Salmonella enterica subsp. enterica]